MDLNPMSGDEVQKLAIGVVTAPPMAVERLRELLTPRDVNKLSSETLSGTISGLEKRQIAITDASGKKVTLKIHPKQTNLTLAGKKAKTAALKTSMSCTFTYIGGVTNLVTNANCK
jgi:hypothetical protein